MPIDEQEPDSSIGVARGGQASKQQRTFAADDEWKVAMADRLSDRSANRGDHCREVGRRDNPGRRVSLPEPSPQRDVPVVVDIGDPPQRLDQTSGAQGCWGAGFTPGTSGGVERDADQTDPHRFLIAWQVWRDGRRLDVALIAGS